MKIHVVFATAVAVIGGVFAEGMPTEQPMDRLSYTNRVGKFWWKERHEAKLAEIAKCGGRFDFVLLGDSITHNWESDGGWPKGTKGGWRTLGKGVAESRFAGYRWLDIGFGGDGTEQVIWRCLNGELDGYETKLVSLMIGTNNRFRTDEQVAAGIRKIVEIVRAKQPKATILLNAILPRTPYPNDPCDLRDKNDRTNEIIRKLCDGKTVIWLDWGNALLKPDGSLDDGLMYDEVHPASGGYEIWADALLPYIRKASAPAFGGLDARFVLDEGTGGIRSLAAADGSGVAKAFGNRYRLMAKSGDVEATEDEDVVSAKRRVDGGVEFTCTNPKMPGVSIVKRYVAANGGLRRTLTFRNETDESKYVTPFTECRFPASFQTNVWHLGAGYIGPYKPFPSVKEPRPVNEYRQSSKGLVFIHPKGSHSGFSHYRVKIDDTVVLPWWHSTIGHYREYHDRLWYLPDGYRMGLGTFGLKPGKPVSVTDQFNAFTGDLFTFFDGIFAKDADIAAEFASIPPPPDWMRDIYAFLPGDHDDLTRWVAEASDEGVLIPRPGCVYSWGDYSPDHDWHSGQGGIIRPKEMLDFLDRLRAISPRVDPSIYGIVISTSFFTEVFKANPEWFRTHDRDGNLDSLFPGQNLNWQTMFNNADCRKWLVDMLVSLARYLKTDMVYLDETQMTNTIDWDRDQVTLDSDTVRFWKELKARFAAEGLAFSANGSGNPYADHNYMESPHELAPDRWRDWVGIGWAIGMMHRMRPGQRATPLYWSGKCDCANRLLALGWVPSIYNRVRGLPIMRATYQSGNLLPVNVRYLPDWKRDAATEVESHTVKREDAKDVLLSFINRAKAPADIPVKVRLDTLGFSPEERINVWRIGLDENLAGRSNPEMLTDGEIKENWRVRGVVAQARISDPRLVYSGPANGVFQDTIRALGTDRMEQYLVTASPVALFAENDLPLTYFYTAQRHAKIVGRKAKIGRRADLLFLDRDCDFDAITANGRPMKARRIRVGDLTGVLVTLEKGDYTLGWTEVPRTAEASAVVELPVASAPMRTRLRGPQSKSDPEDCTVRDVSVVRDGVKVTKAATYRSPTETSFSLQPELPLVTTAADPENLRLVAGTSRREFRSRDTETFAGFELYGAKRLSCRISNNFAKAYSVFLGHVIKYSKKDMEEKSFAGMLVDYRVGGRYVKRVSMAMALYSPAYAIATPTWGTGRKPDECLDFGEWIDESDERTFTVDIAKFAPEGWDGTAFVSIGTSHIQVNRTLTLDILKFNDEAESDLAVPFRNVVTREMPPPLMSRPLKEAPKSLMSLDAAEWAGWAKATPFMGIGSGTVKAQSVAYVAHDYQYLYVGLEAKEPRRNPIAASDDPASNDHFEVLVQRPDNVLYQVIGDVKGRVALYLDGKVSSVTDGIVCRGETVPGLGWRTFFAIPVDKLKFDMQRTPVEIRAEFGRVRRGIERESSAWTPLSGGFNKIADYGRIVLDFNW